jgi:hypothetical protein
MFHAEHVLLIALVLIEGLDRLLGEGVLTEGVV